MKRTDDATSLIIYTLNCIFGNDFTDIPKLHLYCHYIKSILITLLNVKRIGKLKYGDAWHLEALRYMVSLGLLSNDIVIFFENHVRILESSLRYETLPAWDEPHSIYEGLLGRELNISETDIWFSLDKVSRDATGSYYTPCDLAKAVVREAVEKYLKAHNVSSKEQAAYLLCNTKFADLSCGCGEFFMATQKYLDETYDIAPGNICTNFYGIDIDPIALQITICDLLQMSDITQWREIISHFVLGNPLIDQQEEKNIEVKTALFAIKRYYANDFGIDMRGLFANAHIDIIIGNPPWEKVRFEERKFFKTFFPGISVIPQKNVRQVVIKEIIEQNLFCYEWYMQISSDISVFRKKLLKHPYITKSKSGEINTCTLFTELSLNLIDEDGVSALIVKSAVVTSPTGRSLFNHLVIHKSIALICLYENTLRVFSIDSREKFCVLVLTKKQNRAIEIIVGARKISDIHSIERNSLTEEDIKTINPYTLMLPSVAKNDDLRTLITAHNRLPLFTSIYPKCRFGRLVHLTTHASLISTQSTDFNVPIYEGKFIERYDARFATFAGMSETQKYAKKAHAKKNPKTVKNKALPESRYFICKTFWEKLRKNYGEPYMLCWRSLTSTTNTRTTLAMILPTMPTCQSIQFLQSSDIKDILILLALFNSKSFDYFVRLKMPGIDLTQSVIKQIPVPPRESYQAQVQYSGIFQSLEQHILGRVSAILSGEPMLANMYLWDAHSFSGMSITEIENELDELFYIAYGFSDTEKQIIQKSFKK